MLTRPWNYFSRIFLKASQCHHDYYYWSILIQNHKGSVFFWYIYSIFPEMYTRFYCVSLWLYLMDIVCSLRLFRCVDTRWYTPHVTSWFPSVGKTIAFSWFSSSWSMSDVCCHPKEKGYLSLMVNEIPKVWFYCMAKSSSISDIALIQYLFLLIHLQYTWYKRLIHAIDQLQSL